MTQDSLAKVRKQLEVMKQTHHLNPSPSTKEDLEYFQRKLQAALDRMKK